MQLSTPFQQPNEIPHLYCNAQILIVVVNVCYLGPLSITWFNFNHRMDKLSHNLQSVGWNYLSIPKLQRLHRWSLGMDK